MLNSVEGRVIDELGNPVSGAYVSLTSTDEPVTDIAGITGREGKFRLALPEGDFCLVVTTKNGMRGIAKLSKFSNERLHPIIRLHH